MAEIVVEAFVVLSVLVVLLVFGISYLFVQNAEKTGKLETYCNALKEANSQIATLHKEAKSFRSDVALFKHNHRIRIEAIEARFKEEAKEVLSKIEFSNESIVDKENENKNREFPSPTYTTPNNDSLHHTLMTGGASYAVRDSARSDDFSASNCLVRDASSDCNRSYDSSSSSSSSSSTGFD